MSENLVTDTLISANTQSGFHSFFDGFINTADKAYIIKGGPGTGKSTLLKSIARAAQCRGYHTELVHCSSDPDSLDGVRIDELDTVFADGNPPHTLEPPLPGAAGCIVNLGEFWDSDKLSANRNEIKELNNNISSSYERTYRFLGAAGKLHSDLYYTVLECADTEKMERYAYKTVQKMLKKKNRYASLNKRFLSGCTPEGFTYYPDTIINHCDDLIIFSDEYGLSTIVLERIAEHALEYGYDVTAFYSPLKPDEIEHLIIPEIKAGFATSNLYHFFKAQPYSRVRIDRFLNKDMVKSRKNRISFTKKAKYEILSEAIKCMKNTKVLHDELESYYKAAMNFDKVKLLQNTILERLF